MSRVVTPECVISYPALFVPRAMAEGQEPKYSLEMIFGEEADLTELRRAASEVAKAKWGSKIPKNMRSPFRDGSTDREGKPEYEDKIFISARSKSRPIVVRGPDRLLVEPEDAAEVYGGCICRVNVTPFAYDRAGNCGVSFFLNSVWVISRGTPFGGGGGSADGFDGVEVDADAFGATPF